MPSTPAIMPPGQDQASADAEALERASEQLGEAQAAVAAARSDIEDAARNGDAASAATQAAEESLEAAEEALGAASEALASAAEQGGGDSEELNEAVAEAAEALAAAEEALAAAEAAAAEESTELADASAGGEEEPLPAEEENLSGGGGGGAASAAAEASGGAAGGSQSMPSQEQAGEGGQSGLVVAIAGANGSLDTAQEALAGAIRALVITGVYQPPGGDINSESGQPLPGSGVIVLMPGAPADDEKVAQLESELEDTLIVIDGRLLDERNRLANQRSGDAAVVPGDEGISDDPGAEAAALLEELGGGGEDALTEDGDMPAGERTAGEIAGADAQDLGDGKRSDNTVRPDNIPEGIPDGADDDIVARQIREAAMNETDPVLREKLWREYVNYKKGGN